MSGDATSDDRSGEYPTPPEWPDFAMTRDEMVRYVALGLGLDLGHTVLVHDNKMEPGPNTVHMARRLLDAYVTAHDVLSMQVREVRLPPPEGRPRWVIRRAASAATRGGRTFDRNACSAD